MTITASDLLDKIRQQFDTSPYPRVSLDKSPKDNPNLLYIHNLVTPYYFSKHKVIDTKGKIILDAGCGTGYKSLVLAEANPGAKIVGIDISKESIKLAQQRLEYHGFDNAEFHVLPIQELPNLDYEFDYINCDEVLYIITDLAAALQAMRSVLKPNGIIRSNLHSSIQRFPYFRAQRVFTMMGLMDDNPEDLEMEIVVETMKALKDNVELKARTWNSNKYEGENGKEGILMNYLFQGDKGYTISDMFMALKAADLEFISMVNWRQWDLINLFKDPDNLPAFLGMSLPEISIEEKLQLFELINPVHRLIDFWCGHPNQENFVQISEWTDSDWQRAKVYLHPQLKTQNFQEDLIACITEFRIFPISNYLSLVEEFVGIDSSLALCLIPLLEQPQPMKSLVERWKQFRPLDPISLKPTDEEQAFQMVQQLLLRLESFGYVMLEL
ncbi:class I SAM-dependent methyltransferase [Nostoc sp. C117]|uniref:class I SAM-dependent methyltransferase n=1 Tax=Nostoc sp. C117 TaxID=3349875 RepID=UPI00370D71DD